MMDLTTYQECFIRQARNERPDDERLIESGAPEERDASFALALELLGLNQEEG